MNGIYYLRQGGYVIIDVWFDIITNIICLFVSRVAQKLPRSQPIFTKFGGKVTWKKPLNFGGNPDHFMSRLELVYG